MSCNEVRTLAAMDSELNGTSEVLTELAEAEAAEAEALAEAARARAEAARLRGDDTDADDESKEEVVPADAVEPARRRWSGLPSGLQWKRIGVVGAAVLAAASVALTGWMLVAHRQAAAERAHRQAFVDAARNGVVALLSIDHSRAKDDVQHVLDLSTGGFKQDFVKGADDFIKTAEQSKAVTKGSVSGAAVDSVNGDSAVVLLAVVSQVTNANGARQDPRPFRMSVTVSPDGGQLKMSNVEFVP